MIKTRMMTRRAALRGGIQIPAAGFVALALSACGGGGDSGGARKAAAKLCSNPDTLSPGEVSLRNAANYVEATNNPEQPCAKCAFFTGDAPPCGQCQIFNGPVNENGHCDSWSQRDA